MMIKKISAVVLCLFVVFALLTPAIAAEKKSISVNSDMSISINGSAFVPRDANGNVVELFEYNGTTYVPLRAVASALGATVGYDDASRTANIESGSDSASSGIFYELQLYKYIGDLAASGEMLLGSIADLLAKTLTETLDEETINSSLSQFNEYISTFNQQVSYAEQLLSGYSGTDSENLNTCVTYLYTGAEYATNAISSLSEFVINYYQSDLDSYYSASVQSDTLFYNVWDYTNSVTYDLLAAELA